MVLGLFAIFVINALANKKMSYIELLIANVAVIATIYFFERYVMSKAHVVYGELENIKHRLLY